jgi:hypothetical protein
MDILIATLSAWIAAYTGLAFVEPPRVEFVGQVRMSEIAHGPSIVPNPQLRALYSQRATTIYLRANWNAVSLRDQSELVHELVHHFQSAHNLTYECGAARETLAYDLQIAWLREQGVSDPYELLEINAFYVIVASMCRDVDHD